MIRSELLKVRSVRSMVAFPIVSIVYAALAFGPAFFAPEADKQDVGPDALVGMVRGPGFFLAVAMLILGTLVAAGEFRHNTLPATLIVTPRRRAVLMAKAGAVAIIAAATAAVVAVVVLSLGVLFLRTEGIASTAAIGDLALAVVASVVVPVLYGLIGVGLGFVVRDQTVAVGAALLWIGIVEGAIPIVLRKPWLYGWLPGGAANAVLGAADPPDDLLAAWAAGLLLLTFAGVVVAAGWTRLVRRDV